MYGNINIVDIDNGYTGMAGNSEATAKPKREALERIVKLYDAWGQPRKAAEWRAKLGADDMNER